MGAKRNSIKSVKELYGTMFEVVADANGKKRVVPTDDSSKAADIIVPHLKKRCPSASCGSDKCLANLTGEDILVEPDYLYFRGAEDWSWQIRYLDIATCINDSKYDFIIAKEEDPSRKTIRGKCIWCGSPFIEKLSDFKGIRESFFLPANIKKCRLRILGQLSKKNLLSGILIENVTVEDLNIFVFKEPWKCNHCKRIFGYEKDLEEGQALLKKLLLEIRAEEFKELLKRLGIDKKYFARSGKCPFCSSEINTKLCLGFYPFPEGDSKDNSSFNFYKYKCWKCNEIFFAVLDWYVWQMKGMK